MTEYYLVLLYILTILLRVGLNFFFELRYSGPVKKLQNGLDNKILKQKIDIIFGLTRNMQKTECTRLRDFLFCIFFVYEPILSFLVLKMFKIYKINGKGFILIFLKLTEKSKTA